MITTNLERFYNQGFCIFENISDEIDAYTALSEFIAQLDLKFLPLLALHKNHIELLTAKIIPARDKGTDKETDIYLLTALYLPVERDNGDSRKRTITIRGTDTNATEQKLSLSPGSIILLDNTRVIHTKPSELELDEVWQFLYGSHK